MVQQILVLALVVASLLLALISVTTTASSLSATSDSKSALSCYVNSLGHAVTKLFTPLLANSARSTSSPSKPFLVIIWGNEPPLISGDLRWISGGLVSVNMVLKIEVDDFYNSVNLKTAFPL